MTVRAIGLYGALTLLFALVDQLVKGVVEATMPLHERIDLLPFLALVHSRNTGIAFSMFSGMNGIGISLVVLAVIVFVAVMAFRTGAAQRWARLGFSLILGGALGNLVDRLAQGFVTDYIWFHTPAWSFAIFNLADAFITVGAGLVIVQEFLDWRRARADRAGDAD